LPVLAGDLDGAELFECELFGTVVGVSSVFCTLLSFLGLCNSEFWRLIGSDIYRYGDVTPSSEQKGVFHAADNAYRLVFGAHLVPQLAVVSALVMQTMAGYQMRMILTVA
jgi:hypothetical protein